MPNDLNLCYLCGAPPMVERGNWGGAEKVWVMCGAGCFHSTGYCPTEEEARREWNEINPEEGKSNA